MWEIQCKNKSIHHTQNFSAKHQTPSHPAKVSHWLTLFQQHSQQLHEIFLFVGRIDCEIWKVQRRCDSGRSQVSSGDIFLYTGWEWIDGTTKPWKDEVNHDASWGLHGFEWFTRVDQKKKRLLTIIIVPKPQHNYHLVMVKKKLSWFASLPDNQALWGKLKIWDGSNKMAPHAKIKQMSKSALMQHSSYQNNREA